MGQLLFQKKTRNFSTDVWILNLSSEYKYVYDFQELFIFFVKYKTCPFKLIHGSLILETFVGE